MNKTFIVIPARNESSSITTVINDLKKHKYDNIIVVDDGSKDTTSILAKQAGATVLRHYINRGQGAALKTGTEYAVLQEADIIVHFDADGQMRAEDISTVIQPLIEGKADVSFGSRFLSNDSNIPTARKMMLVLGRIFMRALFKVTTTDPQSGFRALTKKAAQSIEITQRGMPHCSEILAQVHKKKIVFTEVPVKIIYTDYSKKHGQSNIEALRIATKLLWSKLAR
ncbi:glycosyltransferase family 2 protein [Candidatus Woesearchaeota archaeon]|nr:glycosyltransferase family 2 protein [Candidatus Woesearchaeota archaeon]